MLPDTPWDERTTVGSVETSRNHQGTPLMVYAFASDVPRGHKAPTTVQWLPRGDVTPLFHPPADMTAIHVLINCQLVEALGSKSEHTMSALRLLMCLNQVDPNERTSTFSGSPLMRYPTDIIPQIQRSAPDGVTIAHYHIPPSRVALLEEDQDLLRSNGIEWGVLPPGQDGLFLVNHFPTRRTDGKKAYKCQALEVRDSLLSCPNISSLLEIILILNRWDVLVRPKEGVEIQALSSSLANLDNLAILDACHFSRISQSTPSRRYNPPEVLVHFPLHLLPSYILSVVASISPVDGHQDVGKSGTLLVRFSNQQVAQLLYGLQIPAAAGAITFSCGDGAHDAEWERRGGLPSRAPLNAWLALLPSVEALPVLNAANLSTLSVAPGPASTNEEEEN